MHCRSNYFIMIFTYFSVRYYKYFIIFAFITSVYYAHIALYSQKRVMLDNITLSVLTYVLLILGGKVIQLSQLTQ